MRHEYSARGQSLDVAVEPALQIGGAGLRCAHVEDHASTVGHPRILRSTHVPPRRPDRPSRRIPRHPRRAHRRQPSAGRQRGQQVRPHAAVRRARGAPRRYGDRGFTVVGVPCNQFMGQEPGSAEEIAEFCSATYGVTFPLTEKIDVNGDGRHPLYAADGDARRRRARPATCSGTSRSSCSTPTAPSSHGSARRSSPTTSGCAPRSPDSSADRQTATRPVIGGRSARVAMPGAAATTEGTALVTGIAV